MVVKGPQGQSFEIPAANAHVRLAGLEFEIDLIPDIGVQPIHLIRAIACNANARVHGAARWELFRLRRESHAERDQDERRAPHWAAPLAGEAASPTTSGSV